MKLNKDTMRLICLLEEIVGENCFNPNSYNGYTGEEGSLFRYPVWYKGKDGMTYKTKTSISVDSGTYTEIYPKFTESISEIFYKFGSNELLIGVALKEALETLEERYDLDFLQLEKEYQKSSKQKQEK